MIIGKKYKITTISGHIKCGYYCQNIGTHPNIIYLRQNRFNVRYIQYYNLYELVYVNETVKIEKLYPYDYRQEVQDNVEHIY